MPMSRKRIKTTKIKLRREPTAPVASNGNDSAVLPELVRADISDPSLGSTTEKSAGASGRPSYWTRGSVEADKRLMDLLNLLIEIGEREEANDSQSTDQRAYRPRIAEKKG